MTKHLRYLFVMLMGLLGVTTGWAQQTMTIGFEDASYTDWTLTNIKAQSTNSNVPAHTGDYFGSTDSKEKCSVVTKEKIASPKSITFYVSKESTNTHPSSAWYVKVSSDGTNWTTVGSSQSAAEGITRGTWYEATRDLSSYSDVYVGVFYDGSTAKRCIDDVTITYSASSATVLTPSFNPIGGIYTEAKSVEISCATEGASIYYTTDGTDPDNQSTQYTSAIAVNADMTIKAIAYSGSDASSIATAEYTIVTLDHAGTEADPYSVADAFKVINYNLNKNGVYVKGIVSTAPESVNSGTLTYYISDDGTTTKEFEIYKGKGKNGASFTSVDDVMVDDQVIVYGDIQIYSGIYEFKQNSQMVWNSRTSKEVVSIAVSGEYQTEFIEGEAFNHDGVIVTATYDNGTTGDVTEDAEFSQPDMTQIGTQTVTVTYDEDKTAEYTITINEVPSHTATFSVNGTTTTADVKEGAAIEFPEDPAAIEGKSFVGWTDTEIDGTTDDEPDFVASATMGDQDVTFYAVFANVTQGTQETLVKMDTGDTFANGDKVVIVANVNDKKAYGLYQETQSNSYVKNYDFDGSYATVVADEKNWWTVSAGTNGKWILGDATNGYLYSSGSNNLSVDLNNSSQWTLEDNGDGTFGLTQGRYLSCRTDLTGANVNLFRLAGGTPNGVYALDIYKIDDGATYSDYCTTVEAAATSESITISAARYATYITTNALDFTGTAVTAFIVDDATTANVHFKEVKKVPAATPIVVKAAAAGTYEIPVTTEETDNVDANKLLPPEANQTSTGVEYCLANKSNGIGFYPVKQGVAIKKAYLVINTTSAPEFIGFIEDGGISTGISTVAVENAELNIDAPMYNIAGQRVSRSYKGVVIQNGKKFVVK